MFYYYYLVLAVLKENYTRLCRSLPPDYMTTINKLKRVIKLSHELLDNVTTVPSVDLVNEKIIVGLMVGIKLDQEALKFCDLMKILVNNKSSITDIKNGMKLINFLVTLHTHVMIDITVG